MKKIYLLLALLPGLLFCAGARDATRTAQVLFYRLTGTSLLLTDPRLKQMATLVQEGKLIEAAQIASEDPKFYKIRIRNWAASLSNRGESAFVPFNDFQALMIGAIRDDLDARELLTGDFRYEANAVHKLPAVSQKDNNHYLQMETKDINFKTELVKVAPQWTDSAGHAAGLLTTRGWAEAHYAAGTNRRAVEYAFREFLCRPIDKWKYPNLPDLYVRRDVTRRPGGNPTIYQNECRTCHAGMDAMGGAFARLDFVGNQFFIIKDKVAYKMNQNGGAYPAGHTTSSDTWVNFSTQGHNQLIGWRGETEGVGIKAFGKMISDSVGFSECMVQQVFYHVCRKKPSTEVQAALVNDFEGKGYHLRKLFEEIAIHPACEGGSL